MERKTLTFGEAQFSCPVNIGSGQRARIAQKNAELRREKKATSDAELIENYPYDYMLQTLEGFLRPESGVSIADAYDAATDEEVQSVMDFFVRSASDKTSHGTNKTNGSKNTNATRKQKV